MQKFPCPCCGYLTIEKRHQICSICQWTEDWVALLYPDRCYEFNWVCLIIAQRNYIRFGASTEARKADARPPLEVEKRDPEWRIITKDDKFETPDQRQSSPFVLPKDATKLFYWREDYWLAETSDATMQQK